MSYLALAAGIVVAALVVLILRRPVVGGVLMLFVLYTRISDVGITFHGLPSIAQPLVLLLAGAIFVRRTAMGGSRSFLTMRGLWSAMALYLAVLFASAVWASNDNTAFQEGINLFKNLLIVAVVAETFETPQSLRLGIWALIAAGSFLAGLTVLQAVTHTYSNSYFGLAQAPVRQITSGSNGARSSGPIGDPNFYALILAALVPLALIRLRDERGSLLRAAALASVVLLLSALMLTYSRGGLLALAVMAVLYVPLARVRLSHVLVAIVVLIPALSVAPGGYWDRVSTLSSGLSVGSSTDASLQKRAASQQVAIELFADNPVGGVGAANYPFTYYTTALAEGVPDAANYAHDLYLQIAAETGLMGLLTFGTAMFLALGAAWRRRKPAHLLHDRLTEGIATSTFLALTTYLIGSAFLPAAYPRYLWLLVGLVMAAGLCGTPAPVVRRWRMVTTGGVAA